MYCFRFTFLTLCLSFFIKCSYSQPLGSVQGNILSELIQGNVAFRELVQKDSTLHQEFIANQNAQHPKAVVVACSDSRVSPSVIFNKKDIGELFVIRTAGNLVGKFGIASIEYAVEHLHTPLIIIMGHTSCGAIKAFRGSDVSHAHGHIKDIVKQLRGEKEIIDFMKNHNVISNDTIAKLNVIHTEKELIRFSSIIRHQLARKKIVIQKALYRIETGEVLFF